MKTIFALLLLFSASAFAQTFHLVPSGDPANPYRVETVAPVAPTSDLATFEEAITFLRNAEGIDPAETAFIM